MATGECDVFKRLGFDASRRESDHVRKGNSSFNRSKLSRCRDFVLNRKDELVPPLDGPSWVSKEHERLQMPPNKKPKYSPIIWDREGEDVRPSLKNTSASRKSPLKSPSSSLTDEDLGGLVSKKSVFSNRVDKSEILSVNSDEWGGKLALEASMQQPCPLTEKQFLEYEQESDMVEDGEIIQERNISMSRWASDSDSPIYSYVSDDDEVNRNERKSDSRSSGYGSGELLTASACGVVGSVGSVERDTDFGLCGEDCIDVLEEGNCDGMDVVRNCASDTDDDCKDMVHVDDDVCHEMEEHMGPPRRTVNMLNSCRSVFEYEKLNKINEGAYGVVYRARDKKTDEIVALKKVKMNVGDREGFPMSSLREINILLSFDHPSVVGVKEVVMDDKYLDSVFMVMEYMEHDLKSLMERRKRAFSIGEVKCLMLQLLEGVKYLHDNWVLHRDLKTSNLLFNNRGGLKICDCGLSRQYGSPLKPYTPVVVTLWYRAPELLLGAKEYSSAIDMWSVGCIMAELLGNEPLFKGNNEVNQLDKIFRTLGTPTKKIWPGFSELPGAKANFVNQPYNLLRKKFPVSPFMGSMHLSESGLDLLNRLLTYDPEKRITADEALAHEWFCEVPLPSSRDFMPTFPPQHALGR